MLCLRLPSFLVLLFILSLSSSLSLRFLFIYLLFPPLPYSSCVYSPVLVLSYLILIPLSLICSFPYFPLLANLTVLLLHHHLPLDPPPPLTFAVIFLCLVLLLSSFSPPTFPPLTKPLHLGTPHTSCTSASRPLVTLVTPGGTCHAPFPLPHLFLPPPLLPLSSSQPFLALSHLLNFPLLPPVPTSPPIPLSPPPPPCPPLGPPYMPSFSSFGS